MRYGVSVQQIYALVLAKTSAVYVSIMPYALSNSDNVRQASVPDLFCRAVHASFALLEHLVTLTSCIVDSLLASCNVLDCL